MRFGKTTLRIISEIYFFGLRTSDIPVLAEKLGISARTLQNRLSKLKKEGFIEKVAGEYRLTSYGLYMVEEDFRIKKRLSRFVSLDKLYNRVDEFSENMKKLSLEVKSVKSGMSEVRQELSKAIEWLSRELRTVKNFIDIAKKVALCLKCKYRTEDEYCKRLKIKTSYIICLFCPERKTHIDWEKARWYFGY